MPNYNLTKTWSAPIALADRDILQAQSVGAIEITATDPATDPAVMRLPGYLATVQIDGARSIRARSVTAAAVLAVIKGF